MEHLLIINNLQDTEIDRLTDTIELENKIQKFSDIISEACDVSIPKLKQKQIVTLPWWSEKLDKLKKEVRTKKRRIRCAAPVRRQRVVGEYLKAKEEYENEVKIAQIRSWKEFCGKQDKEGLWEGIYRVIGRTRKREEDQLLVREGRVLDNRESANMLASTFYPPDDETQDNAYHRSIREEAKTLNELEHDADDPPFTLSELKAAVKGFNPRKAPGSDGFTADICAQAFYRAPELCLSLANKCLELGYFPGVWKRATVVVLRKPGKASYSDARSYRPIGLLPVMGKVLEKMVVERLKWHLIPRFSRRQYGFLPQRSTEDALYDLVTHIRGELGQKRLITLVSLDIEGAFDSAWWPRIRTRLAEEDCPRNLQRILGSYLHDRSVTVRYAGEEVSRATRKGCVQGSIGGPLLWNLLLDPLLHGLEERGYYCQAFADDVLLVFSGETGSGVQCSANAALAYVQDWGIRNKLKFAPHKTKGMVITRKLKYDTPKLSMGGVDICMTQEVKILGLTIDSKLTFNAHVTNVCTKALNVYKQLSRAAKVSWGLHPEVIRTIYTAVVEPIVMYAASAWAPATRKLGVRKRLNTVQRGFAQKMCRAHRTVSLNSALVLAGLLPLDLRIQEAASLYEAKRGVARSVPGDGDMERREEYARLPHPAEHIDLGFQCLVDQEQVNECRAQAVRIFTDGSKVEGKVGASLSMWDNDAETRNRKLKLPSYCTVYQAELLAICKATEEILGSPDVSFGVYSDSRSALQAVENWKAAHPLAVSARQNIIESKRRGKTIHLYWVKAHADVRENERADELAKEAALKLKVKPHYDKYPASFVKRLIRSETIGEWSRRYVDEPTASVTKLFLPDVARAYKVTRQLEITSLHTQLFTGHGGFSEYLHRFKLKEDPSCTCQSGTPETVPHVIFECPVFSRDRIDAEIRLRIKIKPDNMVDLTDKKHLPDFMSFCNMIIKKVVDRNK